MSSSPSSWEGGTRWNAGTGSVAALRSLVELGRSPALIADLGFSVANPQAFQILLQVVRPTTVHWVEAGPTTADIIGLHRALRSSAPTVIVAVGGGSTIDLALLAGVSRGDELAVACERAAGGLIVLPPQQTSWISTVAVPTTLGTGAEVSAAACCATRRGKTLVLGRALRAAHAVVDPLFSRGLPAELVLGAFAEILARTLVPFTALPIGEPSVVSVADEVAGASLRALAAIAEQLSSTVARKDVPGDALRLQLATIGAHTHGGWGHLGRGVFSSPVWFAATELSLLTGWSKTDATRLILPSWAQRVTAGDSDMGDAERLLHGWRHFRPDTYRSEDVAPGLSATLALAELGDRLRPGPTRLGDPALAGAAAERVVRRWSGGAPQLARISAGAWTELILDALECAATDSSSAAVR